MPLPSFTAIAACDSNGVIGKGGKLPWHCPEDLEHFYRSIEGTVILMGYNTFCSLPNRAFINRTCFVFTKNHQIEPSIALSLRGLTELEQYYNAHSELLEKTNFVIGGAAIFELFFSENLIDSAVVTHIDGEYEGDAKFPLHFIAGWHKKQLRAGAGFAIARHTKKGLENGN